MAGNVVRRGLLALALIVLGCDDEPPPPPAPVQTASYHRTIASLSHERAALADAWRAAGDEGERRALRARATGLLIRRLRDQLLPAWNGTPWSYSGTATAPGERPIACGYFVSTTLEHAGLAVERRPLAQQAAEDIILTLVPESRIARFKRIPLDVFVAAVARQGDGLYLVGLDYHVGFLVVTGGQVFFHHASNLAGAVVREPALTSAALTRSSYRVVGKLFDATLVEAWIEGRSIRTRTRKPG